MGVAENTEFLVIITLTPDSCFMSQEASERTQGSAPLSSMTGLLEQGGHSERNLPLSPSFVTEFWLRDFPWR